MFNGSAFGMYVMDSDEKSDILIEAFKQAVDQGYDPNDTDVKTAIYEQTNIYPYQLTDYDRAKVGRIISNYM
jgi:ADP-glucose pyrophosphorylase